MTFAKHPAPYVVVIDDDDDVRQALGATFASAGYEVSCFEDAEGFLQTPETRTCACLVSDVQMPGIGGIELARRMKAARPALPVILISAFANDGVRRRAAEAGAVCVYDKPFDADHLLQQVESLISP